MVKFRKGVRSGEEFRVPYYITVTLTTEEPGTRPHEALDYLEEAIKALPERICEPAMVDHIHSITADCYERRDGFTCPVKAYLETEVRE